MPTDQGRKLEQVANEIVPGGTLLRAWDLTGGISAEMTALEVEGPDGTRSCMIVRQHGEADRQGNPNIATDEFRLLQILHAEGVAAPAPLHLDASGQILPQPFLVIEYLEGEIDFAPADLDGALRQLAAHLARIHRIDPTIHDLSFLPRASETWTRRLGRRPAEVDASLDQGRIRDALQAAWPLPGQNPSVLLHGDYWPGNALWRDGRLVAVLDWEDAQTGDPLADLANARVEMVWIFGPEAVETFTRHYLSLTGIDNAHLPYWDLCAALRQAGWVGSNLAGVAAFFTPYGRPDITAQSIRRDYTAFVNQAFEKLGGM